MSITSPLAISPTAIPPSHLNNNNGYPNNDVINNNGYNDSEIHENINNSNTEIEINDTGEDIFYYSGSSKSNQSNLMNSSPISIQQFNSQSSSPLSILSLTSNSQSNSPISELYDDNTDNYDNNDNKYHENSNITISHPITYSPNSTVKIISKTGECLFISPPVYYYLFYTNNTV